MRLLVLVAACLAVTCASSVPREKRFLLSSFQSAWESVKEFASSAVDTVGDAAHTVGDALTDAAGTVRDGVVDAANAVGDFVTDAADSVVSAAARAKALLGPVLDEVAATVGPVAEELGKAALDKLIEVAPELLAQLGKVALEELVASAVAGKREVNVDHVALLFRQIVEGKVNTTVKDIHRVLDAVEHFNVKLKLHAQAMEHAVKRGQDPRAVANQFLANIVLDLQHLTITHSASVDVDRLNSLVHDSIDMFGKKMRSALRASLVSQHQKRDLFSLLNPFNVVQNFVGLLNEGEQAIENLLGTMHSLASGLLQPTVENVKNVAQTLLDNEAAVTTDLMSRALTVLAPFQQVLGPLFQQITTLAQNLGVSLPV